MSKLGFHISAGNRTGFGEALQRAAVAGNPVAAVFSVDQDVWGDISTKSPGTILIFRTQLNGDCPGGDYTGDPVQAAVSFMAPVWPKWSQNRAHYYAPINECDPKSLAALDWLSTFCCQIAHEATARGFKLAMPAFSVGNPPDTPFTRYEAWDKLIPMLKAIKAGGHLLLLHEYGEKFGTLANSRPYHALRYRSLLRFLAQRDIVSPLVISEASGGVGYTSDQVNWLSDLKWYDAELMKDRAVIGCCVYQLGGAENFVSMLPAVTDHIVATKTPAASAQASPCVTGPDTDPAGNPVPSSMPPGGVVTPPPDADDRLPFVVTAHLIPQDTTNAEYDQVQAYAMPRKQDVHFSADVVKRDVLNGQPGSKVIVWEPSRWRDSITAWLSPAPYEVRSFTTQLPPDNGLPSGTVPIRSLHGRADGGSLQALDLEAARTARLNGYKLYNNAASDYQTLKANGFDIAKVLVRIQHVRDRRVTPKDYINESGTGFYDLPLREATAAGVIWFELFNEVNEAAEGDGVAWTSKKEFCNLFNGVIGLARTKYPAARFLSPAMSQQQSRFDWWEAFNLYGVFAVSDGYAAHCYWASLYSPYPMNGNNDGRSYRGLYQYLTGSKQIFITEACNNSTLNTDAEKGAQYKTYCATMEKEIARVDFFCASSSNIGDGLIFNSTHQTWVRDGKMTDIPVVLGK